MPISDAKRQSHVILRLLLGGLRRVLSALRSSSSRALRLILLLISRFRTLHSLADSSERSSVVHISLPDAPDTASPSFLSFSIEPTSEGATASLPYITIDPSGVPTNQNVDMEISFETENNLAVVADLPTQSGSSLKVKLVPIIANWLRRDIDKKTLLV